MKLAIGCDHAAVDFKNKIIAYLTDLGYTCEDFGTYTDESCDYPVYADKVCNAVTGGGFDKGILICGTGIGMSIAANKHRGIRAAVCSDTFSARLTRQHNDANVLCFGERVVGAGVAVGSVVGAGVTDGSVVGAVVGSAVGLADGSGVTTGSGVMGVFSLRV